MTRFTDKVALVVGAASGIGLETVRIMAEEGGTVVGVDLNPAPLDTLASKMPKISGNIETKTANALDEADTKRVVESILAKHNRIDILVNAVGGSTVIPNSSTLIDDMTLEEWQSLVHFNLTGTFLYCNAVVPAMKAQGGGKIVNISSIAGRGLGTVSSSAYAAAKGGIISLTRKLSIELGPFNINCNAIAPGPTMTDRIKAVWEKRSDEERAHTLTNIPLGRLPYAEDQARVICFLASRDADFVSGTTIDVAGGQR
ncbi:MAG: SDR family NAD(P)-dependent oxidoreductase [Chloroflexota bacterium]